MFWIIGGRSFVMALQGLKDNAVAALVVYELSHSPWEGLRYYDVIWPSFHVDGQRFDRAFLR